mgnify:CR=1 FL=1
MGLPLFEGLEAFDELPVNNVFLMISSKNASS